MTLFERAVAGFQANLPMLLAAGLAGFTWWLIQATPKDEGPARRARAASTPDYVLTEATVARFDAKGRLQGVVDGQSIRHYPGDDQLQIDQMVLSARDEKGQGLHAVAREGLANGQAEVVVIRGGAKVVATPASGAMAGGRTMRGPVRMHGESFQIDAKTHVLTSDQPVTVVHDSGEIDATAMRYEQLTGITQLQGRVVGHYNGLPSR